MIKNLLIASAILLASCGLQPAFAAECIDRAQVAEEIPKLYPEAPVEFIAEISDLDEVIALTMALAEYLHMDINAESYDIFFVQFDGLTYVFVVTYLNGCADESGLFLPNDFSRILDRASELLGKEV